MANIDSIKYSLHKLFFEEIKDCVDLKKICVAGGYIRSKFSNEEINDIDIFVEDTETADKLINFFDSKKEAIKLNCTDKKLYNYRFKNHLFQIIYDKIYNLSTTELIDSFDYTICCAMIRGDGEFKYNENYFQDVLSKHLRINKITYPISTLERLQKYTRRGYIACNGTLLEIAKSLSEINKEDIENHFTFYPNGNIKFLGID